LARTCYGAATCKQSSRGRSRRTSRAEDVRPCRPRSLRTRCRLWTGVSFPPPAHRATGPLTVHVGGSLTSPHTSPEASGSNSDHLIKSRSSSMELLQRRPPSDRTADRISSRSDPPASEPFRAKPRPLRWMSWIGRTVRGTPLQRARSACPRR
jgi:hypothetical protein